MQRFLQLETIIRRAPLGLRFLDLVSGTIVNDSLVVTARRPGASAPLQTALRSPLSGVYGFHTLPGLESFERGKQAASDWCSSPPDAGEPTAGELTDMNVLRSWLGAEESPPAGANFILSVVDSRERFLPQTLLMCLPKEKIVEVPLFSSPARLAPSGWGIVRGQLATQLAAAPAGLASWALVTATLDAQTYVAVADARGMFALFVPYASALPPLGSPTLHGSETLTWPVTIQVFYQPTMQQFVSDLTPPDTLSILQQAGAHVYDQVGVPLAQLTRVIRFGSDLIVTTANLSQLLVDPANV